MKINYMSTERLRDDIITDTNYGINGLIGLDLLMKANAIIDLNKLEICVG